ncbi:MAG TPA: CHASE domain-containing protein [bacterium]
MRSPLRFALGVVVAGALATAVWFAGARHLLVDSFEGKFAADVSTRARIIEEKLDKALVISRAVAGFIETVGEVDRGAFLSFADQFPGEDAGLIALAFVPRVRAGERATFEAKARRLLGRDDYELYEGAPGKGRQRLGERPEYYPVLFTNTRDPGALVVLGYDIGSSPVRRAVLEEAGDTGSPVVSERVVLAGKPGVFGFVVFAPVYEREAPRSTPAQRQAALRGFVQAIFNPDELIGAALRTTTPVGLPFGLLDLSASPDGQVIASWTARLPSAGTWRSLLIPATVRGRAEFPFAGRRWGIEVRPNAAYLGNTYPVAQWFVLPIGTVLTLVLAAYVHTVLSRREALVALNEALGSEITKRGRVEEELRASEEKYRVVADNTYDWEFWLDPQGAFLYSSPSSARITGYGTEEFMADPGLLERIIVLEDGELFARHRREVTVAPAHAEISFRIRRRDGAVRWIDHVCQPIHDGAGRFIGTRGSNRDVTEKKRAEEERERLIAELRQAQRSIRTLEGILPICSSCKKIRDEQDRWVQVESYVTRHSTAEFSHSICPECLRKLYPEYAQRLERRPPED